MHLCTGDKENSDQRRPIVLTNGPAPLVTDYAAQSLVVFATLILPRILPTATGRHAFLLEYPMVDEILEKVAGLRILGKSPVGAYSRLNEWIWTAFRPL